MLITRTVYSLYFPETREIVDTLWRERPHELYEQNYTKRQDAMHGAFLERWRYWAEAAGVALGTEFPHEYPTAGANEGAQALLAHMATHAPAGARPRVHIFDGEYEGYQHLAAALSLETSTHARDPEHFQTTLVERVRPGDWFFVSQPSAIDGGVWSGFDAFVRFAMERLPELAIAVDLTYVGAVAGAYEIDLCSPNLRAVLVSLSKPFGVYYHRVGLLLSRFPLAGLYGNLWFKNLFSLALGERLLRAYDARFLPQRYAGVQQRAVALAREAGVLPAAARAADVLLLATARLPAGGELAPNHLPLVRAREPGGNVLRSCLTPAMDTLIREGKAP